MSDDQIIKTGRRRAIDKRAYLLVSAADTDFQGADFNFIIVGDFRGSVLDQTHFFATLEDTDSSHRLVHRQLNRYHCLDYGEASSFFWLPSANPRLNRKTLSH